MYIVIVCFSFLGWDHVFCLFGKLVGVVGPIGFNIATKQPFCYALKTKISPSLRIPRDPPMEGCLCTCFSQGCFWVLKISTFEGSGYLGKYVFFFWGGGGQISRWALVPFFFGLDAAWLNEGRCPGGRPSVSYSKACN